MGMPIPGVIPAQAVMAADIITGAATVVITTAVTGAVERITAGGSIQEVLSPGTLPGSTIPNSTNLLKNFRLIAITPSAEIAGAGVVVSRIAGISLIALGIAC